jgi:hypothetical protein
MEEPIEKWNRVLVLAIVAGRIEHRSLILVRVCNLDQYIGTSCKLRRFSGLGWRLGFLNAHYISSLGIYNIPHLFIVFVV